jgi:hypothetical protein
MKLCKKRTHAYQGIGSVVTTYDYVLENDVYNLHGKEFADKWKEYISKKPYIVEAGQQRYYYYDYKECVLKTNCWFVQ